MTGTPQVALLTGGGDRPYAIGLATSLLAEGVSLEFIGSDDLLVPELTVRPGFRFLNLRGSQNPNVPLVRKMVRVFAYYGRLLHYAATAKPPIFHILWNNRFELADRTLLLVYYRMLGRKIVLTVHNVNIKARDGNDGPLNRLTLRAQYHLADHLFVHTNRMGEALEKDFNVARRKITVIPFGINNTVPNTELTRADARRQLALADSAKVLLFFGNIAPYKGLEYLIEALGLLAARMPDLRLVIAGRLKNAESYWSSIEERIHTLGLRPQVISRLEYVPDAETEFYFKAADVLVLPYTFVFQSGVMFLAYNFGLPVVASDVGGLRDEVIDGVTGLLCAPRDPVDLAGKIDSYFGSDLYSSLESGRSTLRQFAAERYSWSIVGSATGRIYARLLAPGSKGVVG